ncbi:MAG: hypothetical protein ACOCP8_10055 [archaeon]
MKEKYEIKILMQETGKPPEEVSFNELHKMLTKQRGRNKLINKELLKQGQYDIIILKQETGKSIEEVSFEGFKEIIKKQRVKKKKTY